MTGRDFDPFGSLGPINPQSPSGPQDPADPQGTTLPEGSDTAQDPGAGGVGDLAPWKPPVRPARSPFTPVPGAPEGRTARTYPDSAGAVETLRAPELPAVPASVPEPESVPLGVGAPAVPVTPPEPALMFLPPIEEPAGFDAAMEAPAEPPSAVETDAPAESASAAPAETGSESRPAAGSDAAGSSSDPEFEDAAEFLKSLTTELEIDPEELDSPRWAGDATEASEPSLPAAEDASDADPDSVPFVPVSAGAAAAAGAGFLAKLTRRGERRGDAEPAVPAPKPAAPAPAAAAFVPGTATPAAAEAKAASASAARRWLPYAAAVAIPLLFGGAIWATAGGQEASSASSQAQPAAEQPVPAPADEGPIRVLAMGDMLPHDSVNQNAVQTDGSISYAPFFTGIEPNLAGADAVFCNQEVPSAGVDFGISGYPTFNTYAEFSRDLREAADCRLVNLATNHTADKGPEGIAATRAQWDGLDALSVSGANRSAEEQNTIQYGEVRGVKTALVSFAEYSNAPIDEVSLNYMGDDALVERLLTEARANAQLVIVSAHWGTEDSHDVNDLQRAFAQRVADLGADVVLGTGPHVLQPVEWVPRADGGQTLVWYSLGNMLNTQLGLDQRTGIIASFEVVPGADGGPATVANPSGVLTWMHYDWTPEEEAALQLDARHGLSLQPLAASGELLARTTYGVTPEQVLEQSAAILGPLVTLNPGV